MIKYSLEDFEKILQTRFPFNEIKVLKFSGAAKPIEYQCLQCGKTYYKTKANHLYENKTLCSHCYSARNSKVRDWINTFFQSSKQFQLKNWSNNIGDKILIHCNNCNRDFLKAPTNLYQREEKTICPLCGENGSPVPKEDFIKMLSSQEQEEYQVLNYKSLGKSAQFRHKCGFVFSMKPVNFCKSRGCPKCNKTKSAGELAIIRFLNQNNIIFEEQKRFPETLGRLSYDFYVPLFNTLIEFQGEQHYRPTPHFGGEQVFQNQKERDLKKATFAKENGYILICIPYYDIKHIENYLSFLQGSTTIREE